MTAIMRQIDGFLTPADLYPDYAYRDVPDGSS